MFHSREKGRLGSTASSLALLCLLVLCEQLQAQSGRRAPRTTSPSVPTSSKVSTPEDETKARQKTFSELSYPVQLLIARQNTSKHLPTEDIIFNSFIHRLNELPNIEGSLLGNMKREQAAKRAVTETDRYVVIIQFEIDNFQGGKIVLNSPDLEVKYFAYVPQSSEPQLKGKIYYQSLGGPQGRKSNSPSDPPIRITQEAAGHEAAERIYFWLAELVGTKQDRKPTQ